MFFLQFKINLTIRLVIYVTIYEFPKLSDFHNMQIYHFENVEVPRMIKFHYSDLILVLKLISNAFTL